MSTSFAQANAGFTRSPSMTGSADWPLCFFSFVSLLLISWASIHNAQTAQPIAVLLFMLPILLIATMRPRTALHGILKNWPLLALPLLALLSTLWSNYPAATLKSALEYNVTMVIGIILGTCVRPRIVLSSMLSALALITLVGVPFGGQEIVGNELVLVGLFGSKNYFGYCVALLLLTGFSVSMDAQQPRVFRLLAVASMICAPPLLIYSRSTGALFFSIATIGLMGLIKFLFWLPSVARAGAVLLSLPLMAMAIIGWIYLGDFSDALAYFGKDVTLTGRIYIWQLAIASIQAHPILGVGYIGFWQVGNWGAEQLWQMFDVVGRSGFHFHNMYLQVGVDLGLAGLSILVATLVIILGRTGRVFIFSKPQPEQMFAIAQFIFIFSRTPIEVDLFSAFNMPSILLSLIWIYLAPRDPSGPGHAGFRKSV